MRNRLLALLGALLLALAACGPAAQEATPTQPPTQPPAQPPTQPPPTSAPALSPTATPRAPAAATAAPTPVPTKAAPGAAKPKHGGTVKPDMRADPFGWDPMIVKGGYNDARKQHNLVFSGLINVPSRPDLSLCEPQILPDMASDWGWLDDTTLQFKLHQGIKFHDKAPVNGRDLTADDVVFSLDRALVKEPIRGADLVTERIVKIEAVDRLTVRIRTDVPTPALVNNLASRYGAVVLPKESAGPRGNWEDPAVSYIGSGPFMFKQYLPGTKVVYTRNPGYWKQGLPYVDTVEFLIMPDQSTALAALRSGVLDIWADELPGVLASQLRSRNPQIQLQGCVMLNGYGFLWMAQYGDNNPFLDVRVRRAVSMAIDRAAIKDTILQGEGVDTPYSPAAAHPWYMGTKDYPPEVRKYLEYNPAEAKKLLAEAGYPNGLDASIEVTARYGSPHNEMVEGLSAMLQEVGIRAKPLWKEYALWLERGRVAKWESMRFGKMGFDDEWRMLPKLHSKNTIGENKSRVSDPELDKLIDALVVTVDPNRQMELARQIQLRIADQAWVVSVPQPLDYSATNPWVKGFNRVGPMQFSSTWLEQVWLDK